MVVQPQMLHHKHSVLLTTPTDTCRGYKFFAVGTSRAPSPRHKGSAASVSAWQCVLIYQWMLAQSYLSSPAGPGPMPSPGAHACRMLRANDIPRCC